VSVFYNLYCMNEIDQIAVDYIRPSRTIESYLLTDIKNPDNQKVVYVYNYEGYHFRIFDDILELIKFMNNEDYIMLKDYSSNRGVDNFLLRFEFIT